MEATRPNEAAIPERKVFLSRKTSFPIFTDLMGQLGAKLARTNA